jgi:hypothetical protein
MEIMFSKYAKSIEIISKEWNKYGIIRDTFYTYEIVRQ